MLASLSASRTSSLSAGGAGRLEALAGGYHAAFLAGAIFATVAAAVGTAFIRQHAASQQADFEAVEAVGFD